jgi:hypothetical protein
MRAVEVECVEGLIKGVVRLVSICRVPYDSSTMRKTGLLAGRRAVEYNFVMSVR